jgi:hypothetical protein
VALTVAVTVALLDTPEQNLARQQEAIMRLPCPDT